MLLVMQASSAKQVKVIWPVILHSYTHLNESLWCESDGNWHPLFFLWSGYWAYKHEKFNYTINMPPVILLLLLWLNNEWVKFHYPEAIQSNSIATNHIAQWALKPRQNQIKTMPRRNTSFRNKLKSTITMSMYNMYLTYGCCCSDSSNSSIFHLLHTLYLRSLPSISWFTSANVIPGNCSHFLEISLNKCESCSWGMQPQSERDRKSVLDFYWIIHHKNLLQSLSSALKLLMQL